MLEQWLWARQAMTFDFTMALFAERYQITQRIRFVVIAIEQAVWNNVVNIYNQTLARFLLLATYLTDFPISLFSKPTLTTPRFSIKVASALSPFTVNIHGVVVALHPFRSAMNRAEFTADLPFMYSDLIPALYTNDGHHILWPSSVRMRNPRYGFSVTDARTIFTWPSTLELLAANKAGFHCRFSFAGFAYRRCEQAAKLAFRTGSNSALAHLKIVPQRGG